MEVEAGALRKPTQHSGRLVGRVVVDHQMDVQLVRHVLVDVVQESQVLLMPMPLLATLQDGPRDHVQRGEEGRGSMAGVVVSPSFRLSGPQR